MSYPADPFAVFPAELRDILFGVNVGPFEDPS